ncbi:Aste57867_22470 [Aphanomyces stellatus]|uniref:Aste57867_22470 protein n=1 Tax=Aphanomyces stellatus TaxID=120398 RepID=A0A485LLU8_9STRA|nr:hypothetical protein As57867_022400 [Aphanomyces stellatus]VFT99130.1 Aste57867_22470 [Aphanomyces stellatus]
MFKRLAAWFRTFQAARRAGKCDLCKKGTDHKQTCPACRLECCNNCLRRHGATVGPFCKECHSNSSDMHLSAQLALYMQEEAMKTLRSDTESDDVAGLVDMPILEIKTSKMLLSSRQLLAINQAKARTASHRSSSSSTYLVR